jgi:hypothetical protein
MTNILGCFLIAHPQKLVFLTWTPPRLMMASIAESGGPLRSPSISYDNLLVDGRTLHLFIDYQFRAIVQATFTIGDLEKFPIRVEFLARCGQQ